MLIGRPINFDCLGKISAHSVIASITLCVTLLSGCGGASPATDNISIDDTPVVTDPTPPVADTPTFNAAHTYASKCAVCHGADGKGGAAKISLSGTSCSTCSNASKLTTVIDTTMPPGAANQCDAACASGLASYIISTFNTSNATTPSPAPPLTGAQAYDQYCSTCHGNDGLGGTSNVSLVACSNCGSTTTLAARISTTMPVGNIGVCSGTCASNVASYILTTLKAPAPTPIVISPEPDPITQMPGAALYAQHCVSCHGTDGTGGLAGVSLVSCTTCSSTATLAERIQRTMPVGKVGLFSTSQSTDIANYVRAAFNGDGLAQADALLNSVDLLSPAQTLRKASLNLAGKLPSKQDLSRLDKEGATALPSLLDNLMHQEAFYDRVMEIYNDLLLTDRYLSGERAINLLTDAEFPSRKWYTQLGLSDSETEKLRNLSNVAVTREPLELIAYIVRNDRPFTELLTADYMVVNPYSARVYGVESQVAFNDSNDANEYHPAQLANRYHAGILTSPMFLTRYPTSPSNKNRARARTLFQIFLDTDVLRLDAMRPSAADMKQTSSAPTLTDPNCVSCHSIIDPAASAFRDWDSLGRYFPGQKAYPDMFAAGFAGIAMPIAEKGSALHWLATQVTQDQRFANAVLRTFYTGLTGQQPLESLSENDLGYIAQRKAFAEIRDQFIASGYNIRTLVSSIILSPYYRAQAIATEDTNGNYRQLGNLQLLTPELLSRKIKATLGMPWQRWGTFDALMETDYFKLYGGIDSDSLTVRTTQANGVMNAIQVRMANELGCFAVPQDLLRPLDARLLLTGVTGYEQPLLADGSENTSATRGIKQTLQNLHWQLLGEKLSIGDTEIQRSYDLFVGAWKTGTAAIKGNLGKSKVNYRCRIESDPVTGLTLGDKSIAQDSNYTLRAWMAVVSYLLLDYRYLYQ